MNIIKKTISLTLVAVLAMSGCADLDVTNENAPDQSRALAKPEDVESLIKSTFLTWWQGTHTTGGSFNPGVMADANTSSWGNYGMRELSSEPRAAANNSPAWNYAYALEQPWYSWYGAISAAKDGLSAIAAGQEGGKSFLADADADKRAKIFANFIMGISNGMVAIYYDKGFLVTEATDFSQEISTVPYDELMTGAIAILEQVISDCNSNAAVSLPEGWLQIGNLTLGDLGKITHSFVARFKAGVARTRQERGAADWASIKSHASQGAPMAPAGDGDYWWTRTQYYTGVSASWGRSDYKMLGPADNGTGEKTYQDWLGTAVADRKAYSMGTDDARITGPLDADGLQTQGLYAKNEYRTRLIASRGTYHQTYYLFNRTRDYAVDQGLVGPMKDINQSELDLLQAEAALRAGDAAGAATLINITRVGNGARADGTGLTAAAAGDGVGSVADAANALDGGSLWAKYKYEKIIEGCLMHPYTGYTDRRGWGDLVKGTPTMLAIPGKELEILLLENYTFGGQDAIGTPGTAGKIRNNGYKSHGFNIEWERVTPLNKADLH
jgi:hypothetical protein